MIKHEKIHIIIVGKSSQTAPVTMQKNKYIYGQNLTILKQLK